MKSGENSACSTHASAGAASGAVAVEAAVKTGVYDGEEAAYDDTHLQWPVNHIIDALNERKLKQLLRRYGPRSCLDIGCGTGKNMATLAEGVERPVGVDISPGFLHIASREKGIPGTFVVGDSEGLPFADECFDMVLLNATLHHVDDVEATLLQAGRVLRRGGLFVVLGEPNSLYTRWWNPFFLATMAVSSVLVPETFRSIRKQMRERGGNRVCVEDHGHPVDPRKLKHTCQQSGISDLSMFSYDFFPRLYVKSRLYARLYRGMFLVEHYLLCHLFPRLTGSIFGCIGVKA